MNSLKLDYLKQEPSDTNAIFNECSVLILEVNCTNKDTPSSSQTSYSMVASKLITTALKIKLDPSQWVEKIGSSQEALAVRRLVLYSIALLQQP